MISCIIPAYNEERFIADVIKTVKNCKFIEEIIVVSDGSTDNTANIAKNLGVRVIELKKNLGKAAAIFVGLKHIKGDIVLLVDADLRGLKEEHFINLIKPVLEGSADITIGGGIPFVANKYSGLRVIRKETLEKIISKSPDKFKKLDYNLENEINYWASLLNLKVVYVKMKGVRNVHKIIKYGIKEGFKRTLIMYYEIANYLIKNLFKK